MKKNLECIDAGGEYCPCYLAETNNCITCSILQGKDFCDCNWRGTCIYQEYVWNGNKKKTPRQSIPVNVVSKTKINKNSYLLKLEVSKTLARYLKQPGSYVFLRNIECLHYFDLPMSILDVNDVDGYIYIAYQVVGSKTKQLNLLKDKLLLRGPYFNGILGFKNLKTLKNSECLLICRGIAQAPCVPVIKYLIRNNNNITLLLDKGKVNEPFIKNFIKDLNINIIEENVMSTSCQNLINIMLKNNSYDFLFLAGSDIVQQKIINIVDELKINPLISATNNNEICCGEGICGACSKRLKDGTVVKTCKTQIDVRESIKRRVNLD